MNIYSIVLAAGKGTRMKSEKPKVLHEVCGKSMVNHVIDALKEVGAEEVVVVTGYKREEVKLHLGKTFTYADQEEQLGTAHAVLCAEKNLSGKKGVTIICCGDTPLLTASTMKKLVSEHIKSGSSATVLTTTLEDGTGYGRIVRNEVGEFVAIVEQKDTNEEEQFIKEVNTGTWCFDNEELFRVLKKCGTNNAQGEYYLTDAIELLRKDGKYVTTYHTVDVDETIGVNDLDALALAEGIMKRRT